MQRRGQLWPLKTRCLRCGNPNASPSLTIERICPSSCIVSRFSTVLISSWLTLQRAFNIDGGQNEHLLIHAHQNAPECGERQRQEKAERRARHVMRLSTDTTPPSFSTFSRTIARPRPRPDMSVMMGLVEIPD